MPNEIYHRSNWGNPKPEGWGDIYFDPAATNKLYNHSDYYENSDGTDKILRDIPNKASITLTPTAYSDGSINTVIPPYQVLPQELVTNGGFDTDSGWSFYNADADTNTRFENNAAVLEVINTQFTRFISTTSPMTEGKFYKITYEVTETDDTDLSIQYPATDLNSSLGTHTVYIKATNVNIGFAKSGVGEITIDNVSVKEVQEADFDFSRGSSATRVNEKGLIEDVASGIPRIDYTTGFGSWLLEPQRTNLITYSEDFTQNTWTGFNSTLVNSNIINPEGNTGASEYVCSNYTGNNQYFRINPNTTYDNDVDYSYSMFVKYNTFQFCKLTYANYTLIESFTAVFDIINGIVTATDSSGTPQNTNANIQDFGNGWFRISISASISSSAGDAMNFEFNKCPSGTPTFTFFGRTDQTTTTNDKIYIYGAQLEAGSYPTSYIVSNSGSTTTRSAETANNSGNADLFNDSEGVLYAEIAALADDLTFREISLSNGTTNERIEIRYSVTSNLMQGIVRANGSVVMSIFTTNYDITNLNKIAVKYKQNDFALWINGVKIGADITGNTPTGLKSLQFDGGSGTEDFYGKTKELAVFKEALTDAELESLTSWISFGEMATDLEYTVE